MKKEYIFPDMETVKFTIKDVVLTSPVEETIPEEIGGGDGDSSEIDLGL